MRPRFRRFAAGIAAASFLFTATSGLAPPAFAAVDQRAVAKAERIENGLGTSSAHFAFMLRLLAALGRSHPSATWGSTASELTQLGGEFEEQRGVLLALIAAGVTAAVMSDYCADLAPTWAKGLVALGALGKHLSTLEFSNDDTKALEQRATKAAGSLRGVEDACK